jgi:hypothetical protein
MPERVGRQPRYTVAYNARNATAFVPSERVVSNLAVFVDHMATIGMHALWAKFAHDPANALRGQPNIHGTQALVVERMLVESGVHTVAFSHRDLLPVGTEMLEMIEGGSSGEAVEPADAYTDVELEYLGHLLAAANFALEGVGNTVSESRASLRRFFDAGLEREKEQEPGPEL